MDNVPKKPDDIAKLLYEQVGLLIEKSKDAPPTEIRENIELLLKVLINS